MASRTRSKSRTPKSRPARSVKARRSKPPHTAKRFVRTPKGQPVVALATHDSYLMIPPELYAVTELHILGKEAGRAICGATLPGAPASPIQKAWGPLGERLGALDGIDDAIATAVKALPGGADPCTACLRNVTRMRNSDAAKAAGGRGAARTKAVAIERQLEEQRDPHLYDGDEDDEE